MSFTESDARNATRSERTGCSLAVIAGEKGVAETVDADVGSQAKCNKPDGPCVDRENWMLYFCDRWPGGLLCLDCNDC